MTAQIYFADSKTMKSFEPPPFAIAEVTTNKFFVGRNLIGKSFANVQKEFENQHRLPPQMI